MKTTTRVFFGLMLGLMLVLAAAGSAFAADQGVSFGDEFVLGQNYTLPAGSTLDGNLFVLGGNATLESGSKVNGSVVLLGGNLIVRGEVDGNITATGGNIRLDASALVRGNINLAGAQIDRHPTAVVEGEIRSSDQGPYTITLPWGIRIPNVNVTLTPFWRVLTYLMQVFIFSALAVLVVLFFPKQAERTGQAVVKQPLVAGGLGLLTIFVAPLVLLIMIVTILLIPVSLLGALVIGIMIVFGWISLGYEVGQRIASMGKQGWAPPVAAGIGSFILALVVNSLNFIDCIGWIGPFLVSVVGLGAVLLTRFGTQAYPPVITTLPAVQSGFNAADKDPGQKEWWLPGEGGVKDEPPEPSAQESEPPAGESSDNT